VVLAAKKKSDMLDINCWVLGDDPKRVFSVEIAKTKTVDALKDAIKEKKKHTFDGIDADLLDLWKVCCRCQYVFDPSMLTITYFCKVKIDHKARRDLLQTMKVESDIPDGELLDPLDDVSEVLNDTPRKHIHIIVRHPGE